MCVCVPQDRAQLGCRVGPGFGDGQESYSAVSRAAHTANSAEYMPKDGEDDDDEFGGTNAYHEQLAPGSPQTGEVERRNDNVNGVLIYGKQGGSAW